MSIVTNLDPKIASKSSSGNFKDPSPKTAYHWRLAPQNGSKKKFSFVKNRLNYQDLVDTDVFLEAGKELQNDDQKLAKNMFRETPNRFTN